MPRERERERDHDQNQDQDRDRESDSQEDHGRTAPDVRDLTAYIENRHRILLQLYDDHRRWEKSLNAASVSSGVSVTWFNHEGERRVMVINGSFMSVHWKIIRSLILDLAECGPAGQEILRQLAVPKGRPHA
jgi:hypothetical protein